MSQSWKFGRRNALPNSAMLRQSWTSTLARYISAGAQAQASSANSAIHSA
jgi:hypothetical protein